MTKTKLFIVFAGILLIISLISAFLLISIPEEIFKKDSFKFIATLISTLILTSLTGIFGYYLNSFTDRPILKIEHANFKSERKPFSLPKDLWHFITHSNSILEYIDKRVSWSMTCFDKNEFQYYHLKDVNRFVKIFIARYRATANWTNTLIELIEKYDSINNENDKKQILISLYPFLYKFEDHYHSAFKSGIYFDLNNKTDNVLKFIKSESEGLLSAHNKEIEDLKSIIDWTDKNLSAGENDPLPIDYSKEIVPNISIIIGVSNTGKTPGLIKYNGNIHFNGDKLPITLSNSSFKFFNKIETKQVFATEYKIDRSLSGFEVRKKFFELLTNDNEYKVDICLELVDGSIIKKKNVKLFDDITMPI
ncbi:hypothetical protein [Labilibaculum euxinus]